MACLPVVSQGSGQFMMRRSYPRIKSQALSSRLMDISPRREAFKQPSNAGFQRFGYRSPWKVTMGHIGALTSDRLSRHNGSPPVQ